MESVSSSSTSTRIKTEGNESSRKRAKTEENNDDDDEEEDNNNNDDGGGGDGIATSGAPRTSLRTGGSNKPRNLVLVGRILGAPTPEFQPSIVGKNMSVAIVTWITDLYRDLEWWIELPNVEDAASVDRHKVMIRAKCVGFLTPPVSSLIEVANGSCGRIRMEGINLLFWREGDPNVEAGDDSDSDTSNSVLNSGWDMIVGTPPAWFARMWDNFASNPNDHSRQQLANEFKGAKVYLTKSHVLQGQQRDWLHA